MLVCGVLFCQSTHGLPGLHFSFARLEERHLLSQVVKKEMCAAFHACGYLRKSAAEAVPGAFSSLRMSSVRDDDGASFVSIPIASTVRNASPPLLDARADSFRGKRGASHGPPLQL